MGVFIHAKLSDSMHCCYLLMLKVFVSNMKSTIRKYKLVLLTSYENQIYIVVLNLEIVISLYHCSFINIAWHPHEYNLWFVEATNFSLLRQEYPPILTSGEMIPPWRVRQAHSGSNSPMTSQNVNAKQSRKVAPSVRFRHILHIFRQEWEK